MESQRLQFPCGLLGPVDGLDFRGLMRGSIFYLTGVCMLCCSTVLVLGDGIFYFESVSLFIQACLVPGRPGRVGPGWGIGRPPAVVPPW